MSGNVNIIKRYALILISAWTLLVVGSFVLFYSQHNSNIYEIAKAEARIAFQKDSLYRKWAAKHGGVYVPVTPESLPNPHLSPVIERDITSPSGRSLTLINPAYMTRQVFELAAKEKDFVRGHITSLDPIRPENAPDQWERNALKTFENGLAEVGEVQIIDGQKYMRLMRPFITEHGCLKCHAAQRYKVGDIRGGISVSVPMSIFTVSSNKLITGTASAHVMIWFLGSGMISIGSRKLFQSSADLYEKNIQLKNEIAEREMAQEQLQEQTVILEEEIAERQKAQDQLDMKACLLENEVSVRKRAEERALDNHRRLQLIMDSTYAAIYGVDTTGACTFANKTSLRLIGYDNIDDVLGRNMHELIHHTLPDGQPASISDCKVYRVYREGKTVTVNDEIFWKKNGDYFPVEYSSSPIINNGEIEGAVISFIDISERKRAESDLTESNTFNEQIVNSAREGIIVYDRNLHYVVWNPYMENITGIKAADVLGKHPLELFPFLKEIEIIGRIERALAGENIDPVVFPFSVLQTGKTGFASEVCSALRNSDGKIIGAIGIVRDVTEHRKLEEQLRHSQKMEAIGLLAGGIAHDFNNILTVIGGYSNLLQMILDKNDPIRDKIDQIAAASVRASNLTKSLLAFSHKMEMQLKPANLNDIVAGVGRFLSRIIGEDILLTTTLNDEPLQVCVDKGQIEQILMNFATNARDAMQEGGTLFIKTELQELDSAFVKNQGFGSVGHFAVMTISDTGCGMNEETKNRMFDPFFTTKEMGKGTGLGMSIVYGIVTQHNGFINVYSKPGDGTTFKIYLPVREDKHASREDVYLQLPPETGTETILVVEDDMGIQELVNSFLTSLGYTVILAVNGEEGVEKFRECRDKVNLVLMDMVMPKKSGKQACEEIRQLKPDTKVLFTSGYTANFISGDEHYDKSTTSFIIKPLKLQELASKLRGMLDA